MPPTLRSKEERHTGQLRNLKAFVESKREQLSLLRYHYWTTPEFGTTAKNLQLKPSVHIPDTLGVFARASDFGNNRHLIANYPGALMWEELHEEFDRLYYCPTALRIPVLDYEVYSQTAKKMGLEEESKVKGTNRWLVRMVLVGDPCAVGPLINSPHHTGQTANAHFETIEPKDVTNGRYIKFRSDAKLHVSADVAHIHLTRPLPPSISDTSVELLIDYDNSDRSKKDEAGGFWSRIEAGKKYCEVCFSRQRSQADPLVFCLHTTCDKGIHRSCSKQKSVWACKKHSRLQQFQWTVTCTPPPATPPPRTHTPLAQKMQQALSSCLGPTPPRPSLPTRCDGISSSSPADLLQRFDSSTRINPPRFVPSAVQIQRMYRPPPEEEKEEEEEAEEKEEKKEEAEEEEEEIDSKQEDLDWEPMAGLPYLSSESEEEFEGEVEEEVESEELSALPPSRAPTVVLPRSPSFSSSSAPQRSFSQLSIPSKPKKLEVIHLSEEV